MKFFPTTVIKIVQETNDSYSFLLEIPAGYTWKAGQHAAWQLQGYPLDPQDRDTRIFTIASAPEDGCLMFTTRIAEPHTSFKDTLLRRLKPGDTMGVAAPLGSFAFHPGAYDKALLLAGGIGITPLRSLLRAYAEAPAAGYALTLLYSDDRGEFAYNGFWDELKQTVPALDIRLLADRDKFMADTDAYAKEHGNTTEYLIAGSPGMNRAFTERLTGLGVSADHIVTDVFHGY